MGDIFTNQSGEWQDPWEAAVDQTKNPLKLGDPLGLFSSPGPNPRRLQLEARQAAITRDQWQNFLEVYRPVETDLLSKAMQTDFTVEGDEAGIDAAAGARASRGTLARNLSRLGTRMTPEQAEAVRRRANLSETKITARAENTTRRTLYDTRGNLLAGLVGIGRQVATGAAGGFNAAADNAAATEMALNQSKAQAQNTNLAAASALLGALIMAV